MPRWRSGAVPEVVSQPSAPSGAHHILHLRRVYELLEASDFAVTNLEYVAHLRVQTLARSLEGPRVAPFDDDRVACIVKVLGMNDEGRRTAAGSVPSMATFKTRQSASANELRRIRRNVLRQIRSVSLAWSRRDYTAPDDSIGTYHALAGAELRRWCYRTGITGKGLWWPAFPPDQYLGQLDRSFQENLKFQWRAIELDDCFFYHATELSNGLVIPGPWDLRGREHLYLGGADISGERVLELGPASGALTFFMEDEGAEVVSFDVGFDACADILPMPGIDPLIQKHAQMDNFSRVQNSWWLQHRDRKSMAKIAYGNIYALPGDFGMFDTSVFGAILLHLRDPFAALQEAAQRTRRRIIVTEPVQDVSVDLNQMCFAPFENENGWWTFTPETIHRMLRRLGFDQFSTSFSDHTYFPDHDLGADPVQQRMVTVIGWRDT